MLAQLVDSGSVHITTMTKPSVVEAPSVLEIVANSFGRFSEIQALSFVKRLVERDVPHCPETYLSLGL
jgi:hypothetical protein